jgi:hypothetical protein
MTVQDWASLIVAILTIVSSIAFGIKWLVKHYLSELRPNGGSSVKDQVNRLEIKVDKLYDILIENRVSDSNK